MIAPQAQDQMKSTLLLDVVVFELVPVLELLAGKNDALLVRDDLC